MAEHKVEPLDQESPFALNEIFFSTTDPRGVIRSGNEVFVRISKFTEQELLGKPHSIIRHPDMPRCVFKVLWEYLEAKKPIAAYVKNMAKDGTYYWVMAYVVPLHDGYLSVRLKPTSPLFEKIPSIYSDVLAAERKHGDRGEERKEGMRSGLARLGEILNGAGFANYDDFMHLALTAEVRAREERLGSILQEDFEQIAKVNPTFAQIEGILQSTRRMFGKMDVVFAQLTALTDARARAGSNSEFILGLTKTLRLLALNTSVESTKLGSVGDSLGVVATNMDSTSRNLASQANKAEGVTDAVFALLNEAIFGISCLRLLLTVVMFYAESILREARAGTRLDDHALAARSAMIRALHEAMEPTAAVSLSSLERLKGEVDVLEGFTKEIYRTILSLRFVQLYGNMEAVRLDDTDGFAKIFDQVGLQIEEAKGQIENLSGVLATVGDSLSTRKGLETVATVEIEQIRGHLEELTRVRSIEKEEHGRVS